MLLLANGFFLFNPLTSPRCTNFLDEPSLPFHKKRLFSHEDFTLTTMRKLPYYYAFASVWRLLLKVEQISIFLENKSGRLAEVTEVLSKNGVNIRALSLADTADFGILRLIVNDPEKTKKVLKEDGFTVAKNEVVAVVVPDRPGGLADILKTLKGKAINVEYMYAFVQKSEGNAILIFRFDNVEHAIESLRKAGVRIMSGEDVQQL
jgi:hypothetical protein